MATYMSFPGQLPPQAGVVIVEVDGGGGGGGGGVATQLGSPGGPVTVSSNTPNTNDVLQATGPSDAQWVPLPPATINDLRINGNSTNTAIADTSRAIALGYQAASLGASAVGVGTNARAYFSQTVAIGKDALANAADCVVMGPGASAAGAAGVVVGPGSSVSVASAGLSNGAVSVGYFNRVATNNASTATGCVQLGHALTADTLAVTRSMDFNTMVGSNCSVEVASTDTDCRRNVLIGANTRVACLAGFSSLIDDNIIIGTNNDLLGLTGGTPVSKNVILGTNQAVPYPNNCVLVGSAAAGVAGTQNDLVGLGRAITFTGSTSVGIGTSLSSVTSNSVVIGTTIVAAGIGCVGIGGAITRVGAQSIVIGSGGTADEGATNVILGYNAAVVGNHSFCVTIGTGARALGGGSVAVGRNAAANTTDAIAIGNNAVCNALNAAQIGAGTNNTPESLKFRPYMIHDGTAGTTELLPLYKDAGGNYVTAQGPTPVPQMLFADSDPAFERTGTEWTSPNLSTGANNMFTVLTRDGVNFATGYQTGRLSVNGFDKRRGINQMWRYGSVRTTNNVSTFIPLQTVPFSHYCHMELTITAMRIATYHTAGNQFVTDVTGLDFTVDPGKIGGRTWAGIAACAIMGNGALWTARVDNNWNGTASDEDPAPITGSVLGIVSGLSVAMFGLIPYVGPIMGALVDTAVQATVLAVTTDALYKTFSGKGFSRFDTGFNSFGDYEFDGLGCIEDTTRPLHRIVGVFVKGKTGHKIEWNVIARSTVVPFAHPRYPG